MIWPSQHCCQHQQKAISDPVELQDFLSSAALWESTWHQDFLSSAALWESTWHQDFLSSAALWESTWHHKLSQQCCTL